MADDGSTGPTVLEERLRTDLRQALLARNRPAIAALRSAIAAIDNAGSAGISADDHTKVAGKAADVSRRELTGEEVTGLLHREVDELDDGISAAEGYGSAERAEELRARRAVLAAYLE